MLDVIIVGAGPVGLHLGALLLQEGLTVRILEKRTEPSLHSRAIGIHPPALETLERAGVAAAMLAEGVRIPLGIARSGGREVARLSFAQASPQRPFVLSLKQARTEAILAARVHELDPAAVVRGFCVDSMHDAGTFVTLSGHRSAGDQGAGDGSALDHGTGDGSAGEQQVVFQSRLVIGADGAHSTIRLLLGIPTSGRNYPDTYLMGDFPDIGNANARSAGSGSADTGNTGSGNAATGNDESTAVLHLEPAGIVESFPLPGGLRRWVAHTDSRRDDATAADLAALIAERTGVSVEAGANSMLSAFAVRSRMARRMVAGRAALVGDAAHEISPIGGQGMNLGWLDSAALAPIVVAALHGKSTGTLLREFERARMRASRSASRQAWLNMALGRPLPPSCLHLWHAVLRPVFRLGLVRNLVARRFTMQRIR